MGAVISNEILPFVSDNIDIFRDKWVDFCRWVEGCAEELIRWQKRFPQEYHDLEDRLERIDSIRERLLAGRRTPSRRWWPTDTSPERLAKAEQILKQHLSRMKVLRRDTCEELDRIAEGVRKKNAVPETGWVKQPAPPNSGDWTYHNDGYWAYLNIPKRIYLHTPIDVVNPLLWLLTYREYRPFTNEEISRIEFALVCIAHDWLVDHSGLYPYIFRRESYEGHYFQRDEFCADFFDRVQGHPRLLPPPDGQIAEKIQPAFDSVKQHLAKIREADSKKPHNAQGLSRHAPANGVENKAEARLPQGGTILGMTWEEALMKAENHVDTQGFPGIEKLARIVSCSPRTLKKAIKRSEKLKAARKAHDAEQKQRRIPKAEHLNEVDLDRVPSSRAVDPATEAEAKESAGTLSRDETIREIRRYAEWMQKANGSAAGYTPDAITGALETKSDNELADYLKMMKADADECNADDPKRKHGRRPVL
jgi:hypothetical protein